MSLETTLITFTGMKLDYKSPRIENFDIIDIAKGLSNECRFSGQCEVFYSVAQHSILVSYLTPPELALEALLHDASEAYLKDFPSPLKKVMPDYVKLEKRLEVLIRERFSLPHKKSPEIKMADLVMLATESRDLGMTSVLDYPTLHGILPSSEIKVVPLKPKAAFIAFLKRFDSLKKFNNFKD